MGVVYIFTLASMSAFLPFCQVIEVMGQSCPKTPRKVKRLDADGDEHAAQGFYFTKKH